MRSVRAGLGREGLDALVVFHLPNIRYLTGFAGSTAIAVLGRDDIVLITDGRYVTEVETRVAPGCPGLRLLKVDPTYDATLAAFLRACDCSPGRFRIRPRDGQAVRHADGGAARHAVAPERGGGPHPGRTDGRSGQDAQGRRRNRDVPPRRRAHQRGRPRGGRRRAAGAARVGSGGGHRRPDPPGRLRAPVVRHDRRVGTRTAPSRTRGRETAGWQPGDLVVLDFGGVYDGYCVDITRTISVGTPGPEARRVYDAVAEAQMAAIRAVRPSAAGDRRRRGGEGGAGGAGARARVQPRDRARPGTRDSRGAAGGPAAGRHSRRAAGRARRPARTRRGVHRRAGRVPRRASAGCASKTTCS